jgi:transcriptional regulator with XRE-family HTH domain
MGTLIPQEVRFAENVARVRAARGMSQEQLGAAVGMGRSAIQAVEAGGRRIRLGEAWQLAEALGVDLTAMCGSEPITIQLTPTGERP